MKKLLLAVATAGTMLFEAGTATAQDSILRPGTRPMYATFGMGPGALVTSSLGGGGLYWRLNPTFGYHFSGNSGGFFLAAELDMTIGFAGSFGLTVGPRVGYDFQIANSGFYVGPNAMVGFGFLTFGGVTGFALDIELGADLKFVLGDRGLLFVRPISLAIPIAANGAGAAVGLNINFINFGGGATF